MFNIGGGDKKISSNVSEGNTNLSVGNGNNINGDVGSHNTTFIINQNGGGDGAKGVQESDQQQSFNPLDPLGILGGLGSLFGGGGGGGGIIGVALSAVCKI